jgi:uncharacterized membrane protein
VRVVSWHVVLLGEDELTVRRPVETAGVGAFVGAFVGALVTALVGALVTALVGAFVSAFVGAFVDDDGHVMDRR